MLDNKVTIENLRTLIEIDDAYTERQCARLLKEIAWVLLTRLEGKPKYVSCEQTTSVGTVDMIVITETWGIGIRPYLQAYVWELKAPQLELFQMENNNRACPTKHLYSAENQLLHYYDTVKKDAAFLQRKKLMSGDNVKLGGIIIGRDRNYVKYDHTEEDVNAMDCAIQANRVREMYFYQNRIQLWTWDRIIDFTNILTAGFQMFKDPTGTTNVNASQPSTELIYTEIPTTNPPPDI